MIWISGVKLTLKRFPCGELNVEGSLEEVDNFNLTPCKITFKYESDEDLIALFLIGKYLENMLGALDELVIFYMPYARMDRGGYDSSSCSLRYISSLISSLNFKRIKVIDPHSDLTLAYLGEKAFAEYPFAKSHYLFSMSDFIMFPDSGAQKRYGNMYVFKNKPSIVGNKVRDFSTGKITDYSISCSPEEIKGKTITIVDDLCSYGGTFLLAGKKLKELGAKSVNLVVSHCEDSIFKGKLLSEDSPIDNIHTTDTLISDVEHWPSWPSKLHIINLSRIM